MSDRSFDQHNQTVNGPQTNIAGDVYGPVLSGIFYGPVNLFTTSQYADLRRKLIDIAPILERVRLDRFVGRDFVVTALDKFLTEKRCGYFRLVGQPGIGKTTLLAHLVKERGYLHHFVDRSQGITSLVTALENLSAQVIAVYNLPWEKVGLPPEAGRDGAFLAARLQEAAGKLEHGNKLVILIDALDEAERPASGNALCLPPALPEHVYCVVAHRPDEVRLETAPGTPVVEFTLSAEDPLNAKDVKAYLKAQLTRPEFAERLAQAEPPILHEEFVDTLTKRSEGNFMYLAHVLEAITDGEFPTLSLSALPKGLEGYYEQFWIQLKAQRQTERDMWKLVYRPTIELLAAAQEPVTAGWLAQVGHLDKEEVRLDALAKWQRFLSVRQVDGKTYYRLFHQSFRDFLAGKLEALARAHRAIAENYLRSDTDKWAECDLYGLRYLLPHLLALGREKSDSNADWALKQLDSILSDEAFAKEHVAAR